MARRYRNLTGQKFGRLLVKERIENSASGLARYQAECDCGNQLIVIGTSLTRRQKPTRSCGCIREINAVAIGERSFKHGQAGNGRQSLEYKTWSGMIARCYYPGHASYPLYGGHVTVCDRWRYGENGKSGFECFLADMVVRPSRKHQLDRHPNKTGSYEPGNCRWATPSQQANNRTNNINITVDGRTQTKTQWCREIGRPSSTFNGRVERLGRLLNRCAKKADALPPVTDPRCKTPWFLTFRSFRNAGGMAPFDTTKLDPPLTREERRENFKAVWAGMDNMPVRRSA